MLILELFTTKSRRIRGRKSNTREKLQSDRRNLKTSLISAERDPKLLNSMKLKGRLILRHNSKLSMLNISKTGRKPSKKHKLNIVSNMIWIRLSMMNLEQKRLD